MCAFTVFFSSIILFQLCYKVSVLLCGLSIWLTALFKEKTHNVSKQILKMTNVMLYEGKQTRDQDLKNNNRFNQ